MIVLQAPTDPITAREPLIRCDVGHQFRGRDCPLCTQGEIIPPEDPITQVARTPQRGKQGRSAR